MGVTIQTLRRTVRQVSREPLHPPNHADREFDGRERQDGSELLAYFRSVSATLAGFFPYSLLSSNRDIA